MHGSARSSTILRLGYRSNRYFTAVAAERSLTIGSMLLAVHPGLGVWQSEGWLGMATDAVLLVEAQFAHHILVACTWEKGVCRCA